jgi:ABC-type lipoprotein release transport system permease subunit
VQPIDPATMAAVRVFISIVALLAYLLPARRATTVDPTIVLRQD